MAIRIHMLIGCTASGKSAAALELARRMGAEILSMDSMKIYRGMDIGTAKPDRATRAEVPHHLIDLIEPSESYSLGRFVEDAERAIAAIARRGRPIVAEGGSMMFARGLLSGVFEGPAADPVYRQMLRARAAAEGTAALHAELAQVDPAAAERIHPNDLRRIERALEVYHAGGKPISSLQSQWETCNAQYDFRVAALRWPREPLHRRINARVMQMIADGLVDEVRELLARPGGIGPQAAQAVGYAEILDHFAGSLSLDEAVEKIKINTRRLAKSQRTWMRRMPGVRWIDTDESDSTAQLTEKVRQCWNDPEGCET